MHTLKIFENICSPMGGGDREGKIQVPIKLCHRIKNKKKFILIMRNLAMSTKITRLYLNIALIRIQSFLHLCIH